MTCKNQLIFLGLASYDKTIKHYMSIHKFIYSKYLNKFLIIILVNYLLSSCYSNSILTDYDIERKIYKIETSQNKIIEFEKDYYAILSDDKIIQISSTGEKIVYQKSDVKKIYWEFERVRVYKIEMENGKIIEIKGNEIAYLLLNNVVVTSFNGKRTEYPLSKIKNVYTSQLNGSKTIGLILLVPVATLFAVLIWLKLVVGWDGH